jgi:conjugal transfer pilin signal peptidase TrbI
MHKIPLDFPSKPQSIFIVSWQKSWIKRCWPLLLIPIALCLTQHIGYSINLTGSLPQKFWLIVFNKQPKRGDYILFKASLKSEVPTGTLVIKQVLGVPHDPVSRKNQDFFINGQYIVTAKKHSLKGEPLKLGPTGILKAGQYYVVSFHPDSFDSRYEKMGWIDAKDIIGVAYPLW